MSACVRGLRQLLADEPAAESLRERHGDWWRAFWSRSWISVQSPQVPWEGPCATGAYVHQRYLNACAGRGATREMNS